MTCDASTCQNLLAPGEALTCSARCRKRLERERAAEQLERERAALTDEERATIRALVRDHGCPLPIPTPEQVRAHVARTARWT